MRAVNGGVLAVVIAAGGETGIIDQILRGDNVGTMFLQHDAGSDDEENEDGCEYVVFPCGSYFNKHIFKTQMSLQQPQPTPPQLQ